MLDTYTLERQIERLQAQLSALEEKVEMLQEENRILKGEDFSLELSMLFGLTKSEAQMLQILLRRGVVSREGMLTLLYSFRVDVPGVKVVDVFLCKLRAKLSKHSITIKTVWGQGYSLDDEDKTKINQLLKANHGDKNDYDSAIFRSA